MIHGCGNLGCPSGDLPSPGHPRGDVESIHADCVWTGHTAMSLDHGRWNRSGKSLPAVWGRAGVAQLSFTPVLVASILFGPVLPCNQLGSASAGTDAGHALRVATAASPQYRHNRTIEAVAAVVRYLMAKYGRVTVDRGYYIRALNRPDISTYVAGIVSAPIPVRPFMSCKRNSFLIRDSRTGAPGCEFSVNSIDYRSAYRASAVGGWMRSGRSGGHYLFTLRRTPAGWLVEGERPPQEL